jgi:hypothetical protein
VRDEVKTALDEVFIELKSMTTEDFNALMDRHIAEIYRQIAVPPELLFPPKG